MGKKMKAKPTMALAKAKKRAVNPCAKKRPVDDPYEIWENRETGYTVKVLKKNQTPEREAQNPFATWFCHVQSPFNGDGEFESVYAADVKKNMIRVR